MPRLSRSWRRWRAEARALIRALNERDSDGDDPLAAEVVRAERPVLLLPGFLTARRGLTVLERRLRRDGFSVFPFLVGGRAGALDTATIEQSALLVREKVEQLYQRFPLGPLTIVGHSKGGLIARYYVERLAGHERVCGLVTLGTPHHGAPVAWAAAMLGGFVAPSLWQLRPMSPFLRRLNDGEPLAHVHLASIYSKDDRIAPFPMTMLETHNLPNRTNVEVPGIAHREFLLRKRVYAAVRTELERAYARTRSDDEAIEPAPLRLAATTRS